MSSVLEERECVLIRDRNMRFCQRTGYGGMEKRTRRITQWHMSSLQRQLGQPNRLSPSDTPAFACAVTGVLPMVPSVSMMYMRLC